MSTAKIRGNCNIVSSQQSASKLDAHQEMSRWSFPVGNSDELRQFEALSKLSDLDQQTISNQINSLAVKQQIMRHVYRRDKTVTT
jgi:hypothetical protein